ncbi:hypothetical protein [Streptomyces sp. NPDC005955]|jgi:hypothetical protein|uniref:hypothetical protein n=1 Tax=Streptomyces sp. NPDC005955 TaxID=3364738 RepID=UPI0036BA9713
MSATFLTGIARTTEPLTMLRRFLAVDAVVTAPTAAVYLAASGPVGRLLGVDPDVLLGSGAFLVLFTIGVALIVARREPPAGAVKVVIEVNLAWTAASLAAPFLWLDPSAVGTVWIVFQALVPAGLAGLYWGALRAGAGIRR